MGETGGQMVDTALGIVFIALVLSLACSFVQELIATALSWRAELLERAIRRMLCDPDEPEARIRRLKQLALSVRRALTRDKAPPDVFASDVLASPFVREKLSRNLLSIRRRAPSYLGASTFRLALLDTLTRDKPQDDRVEAVRAGIREIDHPGVRRQLELMLADAHDELDGFGARVEQWFEETMERVSGWYRRRAQLVLFVIGLAVAGATNADAIDVSQRLWTDGTVRAALVQQAGTFTAGADDVEDLKARLEERGGALAAVKQFNLPLGWDRTNQPQAIGFGAGQESPVGWGLGIVITALALSFGAPFWFDALSKLGKLRVAGRRPGAPDKGP